jgi:hypothetical protein
LNCGKIAIKYSLDKLSYREATMRYFSWFLLTFFFFSIPAVAAMYEWTDDKGVVNFTDNPDSIPAKYRNKAKKRPSIKAEPSESVPVQTRQPVETPSSVKPMPQSANEVLYGGHDEEWWRSRYGGLHDELKAIQDGLPGKREDLSAARRKFTVYQYPQYRKAYYDLMAEIENDESRINELNNQLETLDTEAARAGVPLDWRK